MIGILRYSHQSRKRSCCDEKYCGYMASRNILRHVEYLRSKIAAVAASPRSLRSPVSMIMTAQSRGKSNRLPANASSGSTIGWHHTCRSA